MDKLIRYCPDDDIDKLVIDAFKAGVSVGNKGYEVQGEPLLVSTEGNSTYEQIIFMLKEKE